MPQQLPVSFYHTSEQAAYLLVLHKSLYLFGSPLVYPIEVCASRTQTLKTDYCVTNVWNVIITRCACRLYLSRRILQYHTDACYHNRALCPAIRENQSTLEFLPSGKKGWGYNMIPKKIYCFLFFLEGIVPAKTVLCVTQLHGRLLKTIIRHGGENYNPQMCLLKSRGSSDRGAEHG